MGDVVTSEQGTVVAVRVITNLLFAFAVCLDHDRFGLVIRPLKGIVSARIEMDNL